MAVCDRMGIETERLRVRHSRCRRRPGGARPRTSDPQRSRCPGPWVTPGVYPFLLFAKRAEKYGVPAREILVEMGRRGMVGGQEDMIEDTAMTLARQRA